MNSIISTFINGGESLANELFLPPKHPVTYTSNRLYQLKCRVYGAICQDSKSTRRVDGVPRLLQSSTPDGPFESFLSTSSHANYQHLPPAVGRRTQCPKNHKTCDWTCRAIDKPLATEPNSSGRSNNTSSGTPNTYTTRTFLISQEGERVPLHDTGIAFHLEIDPLADEVAFEGCSGLPKGTSCWDVWLEVELWFTDHEK